MSIENTMRPTLKGTIIEAAIGLFDMPDRLIIDGWQHAGAVNRWNLTSLDVDRTVFRMIGPLGSLAQHGYGTAGDLIGKACLICCDVVMEGDCRMDLVAIEPPDAMFGGDWPMVVWARYSSTMTQEILHPRRA